MQDHVRKILKLPINTPIEYWDKYWTHFTESLEEKDNYNVTLDSPRFLIENIISEIKYNNLKNKENGTLFRAQLSDWDKKEIVFNKLFHNKVALLQQKWGENTSQYLLSICEKINTEFIKGAYFDGLIDHLIKIISEANSIEYNIKKEINLYTGLIVAEFIASGFVINDIKSASHNIPDIIMDTHENVVAAPDSYKEFNREDYESEELYYTAIKEYIENRNIKERISVLKDYYHIEPKECFVLFRLQGLKGDIDQMIDDINIYAPHLKQYITEKPSLSKIEDIISSDRKHINVAVPVNHKMVSSSIAYAKQKLEKIIDLLSLSYNTSTPIKYCQDDISIIENGRYIAGININIFNKEELSEHQEFVAYMESLDVSYIKKDSTRLCERFIAINKEKSHDVQRIANAAHWYQKGKYARNAEDKLLFHWISIESLLKTEISLRCNITGLKEPTLLQVVQKIAASIIVKKHFFNYCIDTYISINYQTQLYDNYLDIPDEIIKKASLNMNAGDRVHVSKFFYNIRDIQNNINDEILKIKIKEIDNFYNNDEGVKKKEQEISNDIILIYRLRNLITHNAVYSKYLIDIYANKAQYISGSIIRYLIDEYRKEKLSFEDILIAVSSKYDEFKFNINNEINKLKSK